MIKQELHQGVLNVLSRGERFACRRQDRPDLAFGISAEAKPTRWFRLHIEDTRARGNRAAGSVRSMDAH